jgi:pre-mRNA-splicing factor ATP-dependent RNA helicase DHX15/PRP43
MDMNTNEIGILDPKGLNDNPLTNLPYSDQYKSLAKTWSQFPAYQLSTEIIDAITKVQVLFITSGTGSGKTVLIPKFALHSLNYQGKVGITLPKRIITKSAAEFSALTLDVTLGKDVGYQYKGSDKSLSNKQNKLLYMTDGTLIVKMINDPYLMEFDIIIIDEAHERKIQIDLMLLLLKKIILSGKHPSLKLIIMSATIDTKLYEQYFEDCITKTINITSAALYPITDIYTDQHIDNFLKAGRETLDGIINNTSKGDILLFVTTSNETIEMCKYINKNYSKLVYCIEVFSQMSESKKLLLQSDSNSKRKIIIATNVAESSLTIDNLSFVIDSGYELYSYFDPNTMAHVLEKRLITLAQAMQRRGRTGRTNPGTCYHLYTKEEFNSMKPYPEPTILKEDITFDMIKLITLPFVQTVDNLNDILSQLLDPPKTTFINLGLKLMNDYGLIINNVISKLGLQVAQFNSIDLSLALFIIYSYQNYVAKDACIIVSMLETLNYRLTNLFDFNMGSDQNNQNINYNNYHLIAFPKSDHLSLLKLYHEYQKLSESKLQTKLQSWLQKYKFRKNIFMQIESKAKRLYYQTLNILKQSVDTDNVLESRITGNHMDNHIDNYKTILSCLRKSHLHQIAIVSNSNNIKTIYPKTKVIANISKNSFVTKISKNKDIIYHELAYIGGNYELNIVSIV